MTDKDKKTRKVVGDLPPGAMPEPAFWALIDEVRAAADGDMDEIPAALGERLGALDPDDIVAFDWTLQAIVWRAYRWDVWGAAYLIFGLSICRLSLASQLIYIPVSSVTAVKMKNFASACILGCGKTNCESGSRRMI